MARVIRKHPRHRSRQSCKPEKPCPPRLQTLGGQPIDLEIRPVVELGFEPRAAEFVAWVPHGNDFSRVGGEIELGVWNAVRTNLGVLYIMSSSRRIRSVLVDADTLRATRACSVSAVDEAGSITVFEGDRAIAHGVKMKDGSSVFRNAAGDELRCDVGEELRLVV